MNQLRLLFCLKLQQLLQQHTAVEVTPTVVPMALHQGGTELSPTRPVPDCILPFCHSKLIENYD